MIILLKKGTVLMKRLRLLAFFLIMITVSAAVVSCSGKLPELYSYEDYGFRVDANTDFESLDPKYLGQVKDQIRLLLVGNEETNNTDIESIEESIRSLNNQCRILMSSMITLEENPSRNTLWEGTAFVHYDDVASETEVMKGREADVTTHFSNINKMAYAYATPGGRYYKDNKLLAQLEEALDFMFNDVYAYYMEKYNYCNSAYKSEYAGTEYAAPEGTTSRAPWGGNWWDWDIGAPMQFTETLLLLEDELGEEKIAEYLSAFDRVNYLPHMTAANRVWITKSILISAALQNDAFRFWYSLEQMKEVFDYADIDALKSGELIGDEKDGFYADGSFIQHQVHPYTAGYGMVMIGDVSDILLFTSGTAFELPQEYTDRQLQWIYDSYETVCYKGAMVSCVSGRQVTRSSRETSYGRSIYTALIKASAYKTTSEEDKERLLSIAKYYYECNKDSQDFSVSVPLYMIEYSQKAMSSRSVKAREDYIVTKIFPQMDRVVVHGENYGAAVAFSSNRIAKYESINNENMSGWYLGDGTLYIYSDDLEQFGADFWDNVDWYMLPGTTVTRAMRRSDNCGTYFNPSDFAGGVSVGEYGAAAIQIAPFTSAVQGENFSSTLSAKKAYFFFDNEIVTLGTDISCTDPAEVITVIENRLYEGTDKVMINGRQVIIKKNTESTHDRVRTLHFTGLGGYYFPTGADINSHLKSGNANMLRFWVSHGTGSVQDGSYECVYLPNMTSDETEKYGESPEIKILANNAGVQAVSDSSSGAAGYIFWNAGSVNGVEASDACAVMTHQESKKSFKVAVSDPTQTADTVTVNVTLPENGMTVSSQSDNITVSVNGNTASITVDLSAHYGWSYEVVFGK